jgi:O-antigen ligase
VSEAARNVAAIAAAAGTVGLIAPLPLLRSEAQRAAALAVTLAAWVMVLATLIPEGETSAGLERLASPATGAAALAALVVAAGVLVLGVRVVLARPTVWFVLLGVTAPIRIPVSIGGEDANLLVPLYAVIILGLVAWIWGRVRGRIAAPAAEGPGSLGLPLAAFVAYLLASTLWSADPGEAAKKAAFFYIPFVLLYVLVVAWWPRARALAALAVTVVAGGTVAGAVALYQYATHEIWWNQTLQQANVYSRFFRVNGIFFDPNILGRYLVIGILVCVALAWVRPSAREVVVLVLATAVMSLGLAVTFSRSSALMLMLGVVMLAARAVGMRRAALTGAALLIVAGGAAAATSPNVRRAATDSNRLERVSEGRFDLMKGGLTIWRDDPVVGAGLGGFETRFEQTLTPVEQRRVRVVISHNSPITVLSEGGAVGFALFLALIGGAGWAVARGSRAQGDSGWARWTLAAVIAGIAVHSLLYAALFEDPFLWIATGAAVALTRVGTSEPVPET